MVSREVLVYRPAEHAAAVLTLWDAALGEKYPITEPLFWSHTIGHEGYEPGDGFVAMADGGVVGFALVQTDRTSTGAAERGGPAVVMVHPSYRRRGIGSALLRAATERARGTGCKQLLAGGASLWRFWPGIPTDLAGAAECFQHNGYTLGQTCADLLGDVSRFEVPQRVQAALARAGVQIRPADVDTVAQVLAFERRHFRGWEPACRQLAVGDIDHLLAAWLDGEVIGVEALYSPRSRYRGPNVLWERLLGNNVGGMGCVGVAEAHRGKGVGMGLIAVGAAVLRDRGVGPCIVDWTSLYDFYGKVGFRPWRHYRACTLEQRPG